MFLQVRAPGAPGAKRKFRVTFTWRTWRFGGCESANRQLQNYTRFGWISQARTGRRHGNKWCISLSLRVTFGGANEIKKGAFQSAFLLEFSRIFIASDAHGHDD